MQGHIGKFIVSSLFLALTIGCGSEDPGADGTGGSGGDAGARTGRLFPLRTGNTWTYRVTDALGTVTTKVHTIGEQEAVGGTGPNADVMAFRVLTNKGTNGTDETVSWQADLGDRIVRYREQAFAASTGDLELEEHWAPYKLRVSEKPEQTQTGASFLEEYSETKLPVGGSPSTSVVGDRWDVLSDDETITVEAGTFEHAVVLQKSGGSSQKTYWFVPGVGKVKETGSQLEELVSYDVEEP